MESAKVVEFTLAAETGLIWDLSSNTTSTLVVDLRGMMRTILHLILIVCFLKSIYDSFLYYPLHTRVVKIVTALKIHD